MARITALPARMGVNLIILSAVAATLGLVACGAESTSDEESRPAAGTSGIAGRANAGRGPDAGASGRVSGRGGVTGQGGAPGASGRAQGGAGGVTSTCVTGIQTGDACIPLDDNTPCVRSNRTCTCSASTSQWTCVSTNGGAAGAGGAASGGAATGGRGQGGAATGGAATGGRGQGGSATGGKATGGALATGGKATGGAPATGGKATGGAPATGGKATGGAATGGAATGGVAGSVGTAGAAGSTSTVACPLGVQNSPSATACDSNTDGQCSLVVDMTGIGAVTYDCACAAGAWGCTSSSGAALCPIGILSDPTTTACVPASDESCSLVVVGAASTTSFGCSCSSTSAMWICSSS